VGEQGWAKFVERFGIPPVILTMPQDIPSDQVEAWRASAEKVAEGGSGSVPAGTAVNFCDGARGINPFKDFIHNQRELVVLLSTGGLLTSLAESGSGTLAGGAHSETWAEVRRMDSAKVGSVLNRTLAGAILDRAFPGLPHLAYFSFDNEAVPSPGEVFDDTTKAKASGYLIDKADLEERTGYRLVKDETSAPALPGMFGNRRLANRESPSGARQLADESVLAAFAADNGPLAEAIEALLKDPSTEAAEKLLADLPTFLPDDPALAAVIAEEMAKQFTDPAGQKMAAGRHTDSQDSQALTNAARDTGYPARANSDDQPRGKATPGSTPGSFAPAAGGGEASKVDEEALKARTPEQHAENGKTAITDILKNHHDVKGVMYRNSTGPIDFIWGYEGTAAKKFEDGRGIAHINKKHNSTMYKLPGVIAHGAVYQHPDYSNRVGVIKGKMLVVLEKQGSGSYLLTGFKPDNPAEYLARFKSQDMYEGEL